MAVKTEGNLPKLENTLHLELVAKWVRENIKKSSIK